MDRNMEIAHLAMAEKTVADGERHILDQERRIAELDRHGHDTRKARETLATFRHLQVEHVAHRDLLLTMLQQDAAKPHLPTGSIFRPGHYDDAPQPEPTPLTPPKHRAD